MTLLVGLEKLIRNPRRKKTFSVEFEEIDYRSKNNDTITWVLFILFILKLYSVF